MTTTLQRSSGPRDQAATAKAPLRVDIQGLRALAVALVVAFHMWPERLSGGYIGVDLFFVISGFLITSHLVKQVERDGTVKLATFWARRVRRLLPAAFTVLGASLIAAFVFLPKSLLQQTLYEIGASALYVQNWVLAASSVDYLGADNNPTMAQHFWSLSVEEQFYVAWPLLIVGAVWLAAKVNRLAATKRTAIAAVLGAVFVLSLAFSILETARSQPSAYFITPTRAWEFAAGGLIGFLPAWSAIKLRGKRWIGPLVGWASLGAIAFSAVRFDAATQFPGWKALIPVLAVAALIYLGAEQSRSMPGHVARFKPIQFLGDVSYSVYLWHWPLIVIFPYVFDTELTLGSKVCIVVVSVVLAALTKKFIEDPARSSTGPFRSNRRAYGFMAAGIVAIIAVSGVTHFRVAQENAEFESLVASAVAGNAPCFGAAALADPEHCSDPFAITNTVDPAFTAADGYTGEGTAMSDPCLQADMAPGKTVRQCQYGNIADPTLTIALVGDSHAEHLLEAFIAASEQRGWRLVPFLKPGCSGLEDDSYASNPRQGETVEVAKSCVEWGAAVRAELADRDDIDAVVFSNRAQGKHATAPSVATLWAGIEASGTAVIAVRDAPGLPWGTKGPECVETAGTDDPCAWTPPDEPDFMEITAAETGTPLIDLRQYVCTGSTCHAVVGGTIVYIDDNHLSRTFAKTLIPYIGERLDAILSGRT